MPAMFFGSGALLGQSVDKHGWVTTLGRRVRRLLIPYWLYAAACITAMVATGWRPGIGDLWPWAIPLADPVGSADMAGLWVPLWYVRAYLWFVLGSGALSWCTRRFGGWTVAAAAAVAGGAGWAIEQGADVPFAVGDFAAYVPFVVAGMLYTARPDLLRPRTFAALAVASLGAAIWSWHRFGPDDGVVNRSYLLTVLVGAAGLAAVLAARRPLIRLAGRFTGPIAAVNRRALTVYLWQGFGLVAAQRLVEANVSSIVGRAVGSLIVVVLVIVAAVVLFGPVEDLAARRSRDPRSSPARSVQAPSTPAGSVPAPSVQAPSAPAGSGRTRRVWTTALVSIGVVLALVGLAVTPSADAELRGPLSGIGVVARAESTNDDLEAGPLTDDERDAMLSRVRGASISEVVTSWVDEHRDELTELETTTIGLAVTWPDGRTEDYRVDIDDDQVTVAPTTNAPELWWSMSKVMTSVWLMDLVDRGVVSLDDPVGNWVPEIPRSDEITLEQLARHTSGIPSDIDFDLFDSEPGREIGSLIKRGRLASDPGEAFDYSRTGYFVLALALERASGTTWRAEMEAIVDGAGVAVGFDEDTMAVDHVTDPDGHGYRGRLWSSGGIVLAPAPGSQLLHSIFTQQLSTSSIDAMSDFPADEEAWYYGLGLMPLCPCERSGESLITDRFGLDSATGTFAVDRTTGASLVMHPDSWWGDDGPASAFTDLQSRLLDRLSLER